MSTMTDVRGHRRFSALLAALALVGAACGSGDSDSTPGSTADVETTVPVDSSDSTPGSTGDVETTFPVDSFAILANADVGVGRSRILIGIGEGGGRRLGSPAEGVTISVAHTDRPDAVQTTAGIFTWIIEGAIGLYRAEFEFDAPGLWRVVVIPETGDPLPPTGVNVLADTLAPAVGEPAPAPQTPTLADSSFELITTDPNPDPRFYELSLAEAIGNGRKTVVVFSTPAFCQTAACGPLLDIVKGAAPDHPNVDFVHVEVYTNLTDPDFAPVPANLAPAVLGEWWNLPSEPWVFVVDEAGLVQARFEGVMAVEELEAEL